MAQNPAKVALDAAKAAARPAPKMPDDLVKKVTGVKPQEPKNNTQLTKIAEAAGRK